ncbi:hypothetical protein TcWFU_007351 [Taenia crassiceps]|uniref:Transmembrane protein n=1 Tax=Taenia crassiceps TaxID=6207 RepID=A0ABR4QLR1_9CEST
MNKKLASKANDTVLPGLISACPNTMAKIATTVYKASLSNFNSSFPFSFFLVVVVVVLFCFFSTSWVYSLVDSNWCAMLPFLTTRRLHCGGEEAGAMTATCHRNQSAGQMRCVN